MELIFPSVYFLIPGRIEKLLESSNHPGFYGLYVGLRNRRNVMYAFQGCSLLFFIYNYKGIALLFGLFNLMQFNSYSRYISKYKDYF